MSEEPTFLNRMSTIKTRAAEEFRNRVARKQAPEGEIRDTALTDYEKELIERQQDEEIQNASSFTLNKATYMKKRALKAGVFRYVILGFLIKFKLKKC